MRIVFMVEEPSMKALLQRILPRILPQDVDFIVLAHNGKSDLRDSIPRKLRAWNHSEGAFVILQDQDRNDCITVKRELQALVAPYHRTVLIRIVCRELEAWYWGDLSAVSKAYGKDVTPLSRKRAFRIPDHIENAKTELRKAIPTYQQVEGAGRIAPYLDVEANKSESFQIFVSGLLKLTNQMIAG